MSEQLDRQIADYLGAFWPSLPPQHIQMNPRGAKYSWVKTAHDEHIPLDQAALLAHAAGKRTIGAKLQDASDRANKGMLDIDEGGRPAIVRALVAAEQLGLVAYAIVMPGEPHDGGRVVVPYDNFYPAAHIRAQMLAIVKLAELPEDTEIWPCGQAVALPFGYHVRKRTRGELLLQTGESISLDDDLAAGFAAVQALPLNSAPPAPPEPEPAPAPARPAAAQNISQAQPRQLQASERLDIPVINEAVWARFAEENTLESLLAADGATETRDGYTCPHCEHTHETTLYISKQGRLFSYSTRCLLHTSKGWDARGYYIKTRHNDNYRAALEHLAKQYGLWVEPRKRQAEQPPLVEPVQRQRTPAQVADAERKREARAATAAEIRASVEQRASQDDKLSDSGQLVLMALLDIAGDRAWCRPSVARIAAMIPMSERSVFYGLHDLVERGYIRNSSAPGRTTVRTFLPLQAEQAESGALHPDLIASEDLPLTLVASEPAPAAPATLEPPPPAAQPEQHLVEPAQEVADGEYLASYSPPAVEPSGEYTGRVKDFQSFAEQWAVATSAIKVRADVVDQPPAEPEQLQLASPAKRAPSKRGQVSALDRRRRHPAWRVPSVAARRARSARPGASRA